MESPRAGRGGRENDGSSHHLQRRGSELETDSLLTPERVQPPLERGVVKARHNKGKP